MLIKQRICLFILLTSTVISSVSSAGSNSLRHNRNLGKEDKEDKPKKEKDDKKKDDKKKDEKDNDKDEENAEDGDRSGTGGNFGGYSFYVPGVTDVDRSQVGGGGGVSIPGLEPGPPELDFPDAMPQDLSREGQIDLYRQAVKVAPDRAALVNLRNPLGLRERSVCAQPWSDKVKYGASRFETNRGNGAYKKNEDAFMQCTNDPTNCGNVASGVAGCCRVHTEGLLCDEFSQDEDFGHLQCVCNDQTSEPVREEVVDESGRTGIDRESFPENPEIDLDRSAQNEQFLMNICRKPDESTERAMSIVYAGKERCLASDECFGSDVCVSRWCRCLPGEGHTAVEQVEGWSPDIDIGDVDIGGGVGDIPGLGPLSAESEPEATAGEVEITITTPQGDTVDIEIP